MTPGTTPATTQRGNWWETNSGIGKSCMVISRLIGTLPANTYIQRCGTFEVKIGQKLDQLPPRKSSRKYKDLDSMLES